MNSNANYAVPAAVLREYPEAYEIRVELPGIAKDETDLQLDGRTLTLKTRSKYQPPAGFKPVLTEFERTDYAISTDLPELADPQALSAKMENGVLTVKVGKRAETQAKKIAIA